MRASAVGQKCPDCARVPRSARALGKPIHYVRGVGAGLAVALVGAFALLQFIVMVGFGRVILSAVLGYLVGRAVRWGAAGQTQSPFPALAAGCVVLGMAAVFTAFTGSPIPGGLWLLLGYLAAGFFATRGAGS